MNKLFVLFLAFLSTGFLGRTQQTFNDPFAEKRTVESFHGIDVATGIELFLSSGFTEELVVSASQPEYRDKIITKVENGILRIYFENKLNINTQKVRKELKAYVSCKSIDKLDASAGAFVHIQGVLKSSSLKMNVSTGAQVNGLISSEVVQVKQSSGSLVSLGGDVTSFEGEGDTGSKFRGEDLKTGSCSVKVSTGALISVMVEKEITAKANTGGMIRYKGSPVYKDISRHTGGSVSKI